MGTVDTCFVLKYNAIHERACFHHCVQHAEEIVETFSHALYELLEHRDIGANHGEHILGTGLL